jgi:hypothetical protein
MYCVSGSSFSFRPAPALCDDIISVLLPLLFLVVVVVVVVDLVTVLKNADVDGVVVVVVVVVALVKPIRTGEKEEEAKGVVAMILLLVGLGNSRCARMPRESISRLRFQQKSYRLIVGEK